MKYVELYDEHAVIYHHAETNYTETDQLIT